jgi:hypothetical protein
VASEGPHILGPCHEHILEIASAFGRRVVASASSLPACSAEALHLRFAREAPTAVRAEELPSALGPPIARGWRGRALQVRHLSVIRDGRHLAKPGGSTGGTSGLAEAWLPLPALTATAGTDQTGGLAAPGHVLTQSTAARERLAAFSRFRWASARSRRSCLVTVPHGYQYNPRSALTTGGTRLSRSLGLG